MGAGESSDEGGGAAWSGGGAGGRMGTTGESMGGVWAIRGRFPGPDLATEVLGVGVLVSESGTTLLITLQTEKETGVGITQPMMHQQCRFTR